ncbi:flavodoxin [Methylomonas sp. EFPC1]|uniref:flavodoxin n=1 Tax=Methylomonas sp. EFPC1 TaxID=2812647 RepID=UPI0019679A6E|nr:flavodoxin [Methylomonas sp. EFPC1]QSB02811.1 flavodoxin [Methylomonas sp. EFPC1]
MNKIGIFYGTEKGMTAMMAQVMYRVLGDEIASEPVNVNQATVTELLGYKALILGMPSYGVGEIPGRTTGSEEGNWEEFLFRLDEADLSGKRVALFGLGNQQKYYARFASSLIHLYHHVRSYGAEVTGTWSTDGYHFTHSSSVVDGKFVGLVLDHHNQPELTKTRVLDWLEQVKPALLEKLN